MATRDLTGARFVTAPVSFDSSSSSSPLSGMDSMIALAPAFLQIS